MGSGVVKTLKVKPAVSSKRVPIVTTPRGDETAADLAISSTPAQRNGESAKLELLQLIGPIAAHLAAVEQSLATQTREFDDGVQEYARYALNGQGKRLRPVLALLSGGACGRIEEVHHTLGVIVELIHLATLVHDDVIDEAVVRHRKPTLNSQWGNETSVLVGDCLFARALELAASYTTNEVCRKISTATKTVCAGEVLQTRERFNLDLSRGQYLRIVEMKTGALFAVSCELGASLSGASGTAAQALRDYGLALGIAYQIYDDCVDIFGDEPQAGKSLGTDLETGKLTLPSLLYLQEASDEERRQLRTLLLGNGAVNRRQLAALLQKRHALQQSVALIQSCTERAAQSLAGLSASECLTSLNQLASFLHRQSDAVGG